MRSRRKKISYQDIFSKFSSIRKNIKTFTGGSGKKSSILKIFVHTRKFDFPEKNLATIKIQ